MQDAAPIHSLALETASLTRAFQEADDFWQDALDIEFGREAAIARYETRGKGKTGTKLRAVADDRERARQRWAAEFFGL